VTIPGLSKSLPPGSFIASAILNVQADGATATEEAGIDCELEDKQSGGAAASQEGLWSSLTNIPSEVEGFFALGSIPIQLGVTSGLPNTLSVNCSATSSGPGLKQRVTSGSLTAVQTTGNR
jgi:hypothetical protein